jgi:hypothetical protein
MALVIADRVKETTTTTGTGTVTLLGASTGYQSFAAIGNGNTTYYTIAGQTGSEWEVGIGTYTSSGTTLARTTVLASSNSGSLVNFSAGTKDVFVTYPAEKSVNQDANGRVLIPYTTGASTVGSLNVGNATTSDTGMIAAFTASETLYLYTSLQNTSSSNTSYGAYAVNNNNRSSYLEIGANNSAYSYSAAGYPNNTFSAASALFLESNGAPLAIGTWDSQAISFIVNGSVNTADALTISTAGAVTTPNQLTGATVRASNGIVVNSKTVSASYTIASGDSAMSAGPISIASGQSVTISSGSRWVVI